MPINLEQVFALPLAEVVCEVLKAMDGKARTASLSQQQPNFGEAPARLEFALRAHQQVRLAVLLTDQDSRFFAKAMMGEEVADPQEREGVVEEFWRQVAGRATTALAQILQKGDLDLVTASEPWQPAASALLQLQAEKEEPLLLQVTLSQAAVEFLTGSPEAPASVPAKESSQTGRSFSTPQNLDLLLDVPLALTLRFGERRMPLRDIIELTSGAVIELDRKAEEPVELFLDEKVIARGSVVVVDGCYGLRVTEVCNRIPPASPGMPA